MPGRSPRRPRRGLGICTAAPSKANRGKASVSLGRGRGRGRWRPIYRRVIPTTFVVLAVGPEAQIDSRGFARAVTRAVERFGQLDSD
jgi:hypothetical protein